MADQMESKRRLNSGFTFTIEKADNQSFVASISQHDGREQDDVGALYYVVVVILIYGCSILMMIASYIRKNKVDRKLNRYIKEMASVRKREQQYQLFTAAAKAAALEGDISTEPVPPDSPESPVTIPTPWYHTNRLFPGRAISKRESILLPSATQLPRSRAERRRLLRASNVRFASDCSDQDSEAFIEDLALGASPGALSSLVTPMLDIVKLASLMAPHMNRSSRVTKCEADQQPHPTDTDVIETTVQIDNPPLEIIVDEDVSSKAGDMPEDISASPNSQSVSSCMISSPSSSSAPSSPSASSSSSSSNGSDTSSPSSSTCYTADYQVVTTV